MDIIDKEGFPDFSEIIELIRAEWPVEFGELRDEEMVEEMDKSFNLDTDRVRYLIDGEKVIGFYRYSRWPREDRSSTTAHTFDISILPERHREGLGTMLMNDMIETCKSEGYKMLLSRSFKSNVASIELHRSLNFSLHLETEDSFVWEIEL